MRVRNLITLDKLPFYYELFFIKQKRKYISVKEIAHTLGISIYMARELAHALSHSFNLLYDKGILIKDEDLKRKIEEGRIKCRV